MNDAPQKRQAFWPLVFLVLNIAAILIWFHLSGFFTTRELAFMAMTPNGAEIRPDAVSHIDIEFDSALDPGTVGESALRLIPPVPGTAELVDGKILRYRLLEKLRPATGYQVVWSPKIRGKYGQAVPQELAEFSTTRFAFVDASQTSFDQDSYTVELTFNQPLSATDLDEALTGRFSLPERYGRETDRCAVVSSGISNTHRIRLRESRASYAAVGIKAGLTGRDGNLGLAEDVELVWQIAGADTGGVHETPAWATGPDVRELKPSLSFLGMSPEWDGTDAVVRVRTTAPLDAVEAGKFIRIEPPVAAVFSRTWNGLKISGDFQPGKQYRVTLKRGLPAGDAGELAEDIGRNVWFEDLPPWYAFSFGGGYLAPGGLLKVPVDSVNVEALKIAVRRLYPSNLVEMAMRDYDDDVEEEHAAPARETQIPVGRHRNQKRQTLLDLRELIDGQPGGVYGLEIRTEEEHWRTRQATVVVSDIGLDVRVGRGRLLVWTTSLEKGTPKAKCPVRIYSNRRQLVAEGETDANGVADLPLPSLLDGEQAVLAIAGGDAEMTFVRLDRNRNPRAGDASSGTAYADAYDAFVSLDRGVYRGGETVKAALLVRDRDVKETPRIPVVARLVASDGKVVSNQAGTTDPTGRFLVEFSLPRHSPGGQYEVEAALPGAKTAIGSAPLRIADYIPETLRLSISLPEDVDASVPVPLSLKADRLAGGETGVLSGVGLVTFTPAPFSPEGWAGWNFGDGRVQGRQKKEIERRFDTTSDGEGRTEWRIPDLETFAAIRMAVRAEVMDHGGRAVSAGLGRIVHAAPFYLGLKTPERIVSGDAPSFSLAGVDPKGAAASPDGEWRATLYRIEYSGVYKRRDDGRLVYEWTRREIDAGADAGEWKNGRAEASFGELAGGRYLLVAESGDGKAATLEFGVGGAGNDWVSEDPEIMPAEFENNRYPVDSTAIALFTAPFAGEALVTVETDRVLENRVVKFAAGENKVEVPVTTAMRPNAFVTATLVRPVGAEAAWKPHRAHGVARLRVDNADRKLTAAVSAPEALTPGSEAEITVDVSSPDGKPVENASVILWGVDEGVLSLTGFKTPSPWDHFYRPRRLMVADVDMYSRLAPELEEWRQGRDPVPGGGEGDDEIGSRMNPVAADRVKAVVLHAGGLTTDAEGRATAKFAVPEAAVGLRFMAWASSGAMMGSGERGTEIRAPISFISSWPRFAAPGDEFQVNVLVLNRSGRDGEAVVSASSDGGLSFAAAEMRVFVADGKLASVALPARAETVGTAKSRVTVTLGDDSFGEELELAIRPPVMFQRASGVVRIDGGAGVSLEPGKDLLADHGRVKLMAGGSPQLNLAGSMEYLLSYPYGCSEQTASRLAAIVALPDLLALSRPETVGEEELTQLAKAALDRLAGMQNGNGGFRPWPTWGDSSFWATAQILYILEECVAHGVAVPESMLASSRRYLRDNVESHMNQIEKTDGEPDRDMLRYRTGEDVAIACLALAKGGNIRRAWLVRLDEIAEACRLKGAPVASSTLAFLCEAIWLAGDPVRARELFDRYGPGGEMAGLAGDPALDGASWLAAGLRLGLGGERLAGITAGLNKALSENSGNWSTRQNAFAALSLGKYWRAFRPNPDTVAEVSIDGAVSAFPAAKGKMWEKLSPSVAITAAAPKGGEYFLFWVVEGVPLSGAATEKDMGLTVRRTVSDSAGNRLTAPYELRQGEVYTVTIMVEGDADDLVVADLLPAGVEIEDPDLKGRDSFRQREGEDKLGIKHLERKDDRLLLFGSVRARGGYRYQCRAVTPGDYVWPAVDAARMYDPSVWSAHGQTRVRIAPLAAAKDGEGE